MKEKTSLERAREELLIIEKLQKADLCTIDCENKIIERIPVVQNISLDATIYLGAFPQSMDISKCGMGYKSLEKCPIYQAEIKKHKENAIAILKEI